MSCESLIFGDLKYIHCWRNNQYFLYIVLYIPLVLSILKNEINNFFDEHWGEGGVKIRQTSFRVTLYESVLL